jgi:hypothetical protein
MSERDNLVLMLFQHLRRARDELEKALIDAHGFAQLRRKVSDTLLTLRQVVPAFAKMIETQEAIEEAKDANTDPGNQA